MEITDEVLAAVASGDGLRCGWVHFYGARCENSVITMHSWEWDARGELSLTAAAVHAILEGRCSIHREVGL